jgi:hypothetical protein
MDGRCGDGFREAKVKRWRQKAVDKEEWASVIKEAKAVRGPYRRGVSSSKGPSDIVDIEITCCAHTHCGQYGVSNRYVFLCSIVTYMPYGCPNYTVLVPPLKETKRRLKPGTSDDLKYAPLPPALSAL